MVAGYRLLTIESLLLVDMVSVMNLHRIASLKLLELASNIRKQSVQGTPWLEVTSREYNLVFNQLIVA